MPASDPSNTTPLSPTRFRADLDCAAVGMLTIVSLRDLRTYGRESRWVPTETRRNAELSAES